MARASKALFWGGAVPRAVRSSLLLPSVFVGFKGLDFGSAHQLWYSVGLKLLNCGTQAFIRVILLVCLIFVVLDANEVRVNTGRIQ